MIMMKRYSHKLKSEPEKPEIEKRVGGNGRINVETVPRPTVRSRIVQLKERSVIMLKKDLILRNPLRFMVRDTEELLPKGGFGVVMARAGVGKTALLVQLALNALLKEINVLHISLDDPVKKVSLWYKEMFRHLAESNTGEPVQRIWESLQPHRFIMTFKVEGFSVPKLEERLTDLIEQDIFTPRMILIDGLPFDASVGPLLSDMKTLAAEYGVCTWFAVTTHRHQAPGSGGLPTQLEGVADLFEMIIQLQPDGKKIHVKQLNAGTGDTGMKPMILDPSTMLLVENE
jgi:hypothetical protein